MNGLNGKRLLLLGGSMWREAIQDFARENGIVLLATGNDPSAGIFEIADECYAIDSTNANAMKRLIAEKKVDGVYMGGSETVISAACEYINELGMPCYCTKEQWSQLQDKRRFKRLCEDHGLPVVSQHELVVDGLTPRQLDYPQFPVVTKPADGCGSSGFSVCNNWEELILGFHKAKRSSPSGSVLVEKFVNNKAIGVFYTFSNGRMYFSGIQDKYPVRFGDQGGYVGGAYVFESGRKDAFRSRFEDRIARMFRSLDIKEGSLWMEVFVDGDDFCFNEAGYRYGGSISVYPVNYFYDYNQVAADIYYALTGESRISGFKPLIGKHITRNKRYCVYPLYLRPGTIRKVQGVEQVRQMKNVVAFPIRVKEGSMVLDTRTFFQTFGLLHFVFDTEDEFRNTVRTALRLLRVIDDYGNDMILPLFDLESIGISV